MNISTTLSAWCSLAVGLFVLGCDARNRDETTTHLMHTDIARGGSSNRGSRADHAAGVSVVDSAGITVVHFPKDVMEAADSIAFATEADFELGTGAVTFSLVGHCAFTADGGVVIADVGVNHLRSFKADGTTRDTIGHQGLGPGEFASLSRFVVGPNDTVAAWDGSARRINVFASNGTFVRSLPLNVGTRIINPLAFESDGRVVVLVRPLPPPTSGNVGFETLWPVVAVSADGSRLDTIVEVRGQVYRPRVGAPGVSLELLGASASVVSGTRGLWYLGGDIPEALLYDMSGKTLTSVRWYEPPSSDPAQAARSFLDERRKTAEKNGRTQQPSSWESAPVPKKLPTASQLLPLPTGGFAIEVYRLPMDNTSDRVWYLFDSAGWRVRKLRVPANWLVRAINGNSFLVTLRDSTGVQLVRKYSFASTG